MVTDPAGIDTDRAARGGELESRFSNPVKLGVEMVTLPVGRNALGPGIPGTVTVTVDDCPAVREVGDVEIWTGVTVRATEKLEMGTDVLPAYEPFSRNTAARLYKPAAGVNGKAK